jgi:hypothetical protein
LLLKPYVSDGRSALESPPPVEVACEEEYKLAETLQSAYWYNVFCYWVKYRRYTIEESKWLPAENLTNAPDMVYKFYAAHPNQPKPLGWVMYSRPSRQQIVAVTGKPTLHYQ